MDKHTEHQATKEQRRRASWVRYAERMKQVHANEEAYRRARRLDKEGIIG